MREPGSQPQFLRKKFEVCDQEFVAHGRQYYCEQLYKTATTEYIYVYIQVNCSSLAPSVMKFWGLILFLTKWRTENVRRSGDFPAKRPSHRHPTLHIFLVVKNIYPRTIIWSYRSVAIFSLRPVKSTCFFHLKIGNKIFLRSLSLPVGLSTS